MADLVKRLREEATTLSGIGIDRGSVDASLDAMLASEAADRIEALEAALRDARFAIDTGAVCIGETTEYPPELILSVICKIERALGRAALEGK